MRGAAVCCIAKPFVSFHAFGNAGRIMDPAIPTSIGRQGILIVMVNRGENDGGFFFAVFFY
jgi:hypothetical protein